MIIKNKYIVVVICCFMAVAVNATVKTINTTFTQTTTITPLSDVSQISSLSINGSVVFNHDSSLVRVLVRDAVGTEYLVYERYPLCATSKSITFTSEAEETNILLNIKPVSIVVVVLNASLTLGSLDYSTALTSQTATQVQQAQGVNLHNKNTTKIALINGNKTVYNIKWTAGHTQLSDFAFFVKKRYLGNKVDYNESGYEFYVGGVFRAMSNPYGSLTGGTKSSSNFVSEFNWCKMHNANISTSPYYDGDALGGGWATPIRNQLWGSPLVCGSCWDHSALALVEMYINLYYNKHIDKDLSEQEIISCSGYDCSGAWSSSALTYVKNNRIAEESCFPYVGYEQLCSKKCTTPNTIGITNFGYVSGSTSDDIKKVLITQGPITAGHTGHSQLLVGWQTDATDGSTIWIYKDSHGINHGVNGFTYENESRGHHYNEYLLGAPIGINATPQCFDKDGDGYFNWGIGPKPTTCPPCAPDDEDWNDNDPKRAIMDKNTGEIKLITSPPIGPTVNVSVGYQSFTYWSTNQSPCGNVMVSYPYSSSSNGNPSIRGLIIQANVNLVANATLTTDNCTTKLVGGTIDNANITLQNNGKLIVSDGGTLQLGANDKINITAGSSLVLLQSKITVK